MVSDDLNDADALISVLLLGGSMKIKKFKEIVKEVFKVEGKIMNKETIAKSCMLVANMMENKKTQFSISDLLTYDIMVKQAE